MKGMENLKQDIKIKRIDDLYALMARYRLKIKDVCAEAGIDSVDSVYVNMRKYDISFERLDSLEEAAHSLINEIKVVQPISTDA